MTAEEEIGVEPLPRHPVDALRCPHCGFPLEPERLEPVRWTRARLSSLRKPVGSS